MSISVAETIPADPDPVAVQVVVSGMTLRLMLSNGPQLIVPLAQFPRRLRASEAQRANWRLIGRGHGIHWPDIDEDMSVRALLGRPT